MATTHPTTYLIDGSGYIFRAFFAIQHLSAKDGMPTNALYGFTRMVLKTLSAANSSKVAMIFDAGKKTFRNDLYPEYKANRKECPEELRPQMPFFRELSAALGLPVLELPGYEADDIIGTLADRLTALGREVVIVSGDKDLMQLVNQHVQIWDTMKDARYGPPQVVEKFGVTPGEVVEYLALMGDSSDNIPGVDGVGPKTATQLVQKYKTIEGVIEHLSDIRNDTEIRNRKKIADTIESAVDILRLSRKLTEIDRNVPLDSMLADTGDIESLLTRKEVDSARLHDLFERLDFSSLLKELTSVLGPVAPRTSTQSYDYKTITRAEFPGWLATFKEQPEFSFDIETTSLDVHEAKIVGMSICWEDGGAYYVPLAHKDIPDQLGWEEFREAVRHRFTDPNVNKSGQNVKYDISVLELNGLPVRGVAFDTMIAAYLLNPDSRSYNLTALSNDLLHLSVIEYEDVTKGSADFSEVAIDAATQYACQDAHYAWLLKKTLAPQIESEGLTQVLMEIEVPLIPILAKMERLGMKVDAEMLARMSAEFETQLKDLEGRIHSSAGAPFNINSPKQLADVLFVKLGIATKGVKKTKTGLSTDSSVLEKLSGEHELPALVLEYRMLHKLKSTYTDALAGEISPLTGRVHTRLNQAVTGTGRLSSSEPNLQNIPIQSEAGRRIRSAFIPEPGKVLISADYSQIELRLLAHLSEDENMIAAFAEGADIHTRTAREVMGLHEGDEVSDQIRRIGKTINFGIVYGMGPFRLARDLGIPVYEASAYIQSYFDRYPRVKEYFKRLEDDALSKGEVRTLFGRRRVISALDTSDRDQNFAKRAAINAPIQGSAADIIKLAMIHVDHFLERSPHKGALILQIHDELLIECEDLGNEKNMEMVTALRGVMERVVPLRVPLHVDAGIGYTWQEAQS